VRRLLNLDRVDDVEGGSPTSSQQGFLDASEPTSGCQIARFLGVIDVLKSPPKRAERGG
jgi:hypothetical protein